MADGLEVARERVLAYRAAAQQLDRPGLRPADLAVLDLGVQDTPYGSARQALAVRGAAEFDDDRLELVWSTRGAPHLHRRAELPALGRRPLAAERRRRHPADRRADPRRRPAGPCRVPGDSHRVRRGGRGPDGQGRGESGSVPATPADVAGFLGTSATELRSVWPTGLAEVRVDGRRAWLPADRLDALRGAEQARGVRLLPPGDPFLQARDRDLLVPEKAHQAQLWRMIGNPGALLVDGEVAGTWRAKQAGKGRLDLTVSPFGAVSARAHREIEAEAASVAAARGVTDVRARVDSA